MDLFFILLHGLLILLLGVILKAQAVSLDTCEEWEYPCGYEDTKCCVCLSCPGASGCQHEDDIVYQKVCREKIPYDRMNCEGTSHCAELLDYRYKVETCPQIPTQDNVAIMYLTPPAKHKYKVYDNHLFAVVKLTCKEGSHAKTLKCYHTGWNDTLDLTCKNSGDAVNTTKSMVIPVVPPTPSPSPSTGPADVTSQNTTGSDTIGEDSGTINEHDKGPGKNHTVAVVTTVEPPSGPSPVLWTILSIALIPIGLITLFYCWQRRRKKKKKKKRQRQIVRQNDDIVAIDMEDFTPKLENGVLNGHIGNGHVPNGVPPHAEGIPLISGEDALEGSQGPNEEATDDTNAQTPDLENVPEDRPLLSTVERQNVPQETNAQETLTNDINAQTSSDLGSIHSMNNAEEPMIESDEQTIQRDSDTNEQTLTEQIARSNSNMSFRERTDREPTESSIDLDSGLGGGKQQSRSMEDDNIDKTETVPKQAWTGEMGEQGAVEAGPPTEFKKSLAIPEEGTRDYGSGHYGHIPAQAESTNDEYVSPSPVQEPSSDENPTGGATGASGGEQSVQMCYTAPPPPQRSVENLRHVGSGGPPPPYHGDPDREHECQLCFNEARNHRNWTEFLQALGERLDSERLEWKIVADALGITKSKQENFEYRAPKQNASITASILDWYAQSPEGRNKKLYKLVHRVCHSNFYYQNEILQIIREHFPEHYARCNVCHELLRKQL